MSVFLMEENNKGKLVKGEKVSENYYVNFALINDNDIKIQVENELKEYIKSKKDAVKKARKLTDKKYTLLASEELKKHFDKITDDNNTFEENCNIINDELKRFAGYGMILTSYDYFNVRADIGTNIAKENLKTLKTLKFDKQSVSIEDMLKELKISSD